MTISDSINLQVGTWYLRLKLEIRIPSKRMDKTSLDVIAPRLNQLEFEAL